MSCYVVAHVEVTDYARYSEYAVAVVEQVKSLGGRVLAAGAVEVVEGDPMTNHNVILEFPDERTARSWWNSTEYRAIVPIRHEASSRSQAAILQQWTGF